MPAKKVHNFSDEEVQEIILTVVKKKRPDTIENLVQFVSSDYPINVDVILRNVQELEDEKKLELFGRVFPVLLKEYLISSQALWYWGVMFLVVLANFLIFLVPADSSSFFLPLRNVVGIVVVLYLPGYSIIKALYPVSVPFKTQSNMLDAIERIALGLGLSLAVVPVISFALYYLPSGLSLIPLSESILFITCILATLAIWREYKARRAMFYRRVRKNDAFFEA
jgi:uncharacterized membrane protein